MGLPKYRIFSGFRAPGGTILRPNCGPDGSLDVERGLGGPGTSKIRVFSSNFAIKLQKCRIFSYFRGHSWEFLLLLGTIF